MRRFVLPRQYHQGLKVLAQLSAAEAEQFRAELIAAEQFRSVEELERLTAEALPEGQADEADDVLDALLALRGQVARGSLSTEELAQAVAATSTLEIEDESQRERFAELLAGLLEGSPIVTTAAAAELLVQNERSLRGVRIISDIRPVFGQDVTDAPRGAVLLHKLQIGYWGADGSAMAIDFSLDQRDLRALERAVERAIAKYETLKGFLQSSGVESFEVEDEEE